MLAQYKCLDYETIIRSTKAEHFNPRDFLNCGTISFYGANPISEAIKSYTIVQKYYTATASDQDFMYTIVYENHMVIYYVTRAELLYSHNIIKSNYLSGELGIYPALNKA